MRDSGNLEAKSLVYEALVAQLARHRNRDPAKVIDEIERVAGFAWLNHPKIFADGRIENILLDFNEDVANAAQRCWEGDCYSDSNLPRILHNISHWRPVIEG